MRAGRGRAQTAFEPRAWGRPWGGFRHSLGRRGAHGRRDEQAARGQATLPQGGQVAGCPAAGGFLLCTHTEADVMRFLRVSDEASELSLRLTAFRMCSLWSRRAPGSTGGRAEGQLAPVPWGQACTSCRYHPELSGLLCFQEEIPRFVATWLLCSL